MEKLCLGEYFSQFEGRHHEFKNNYNNKHQRKYKETLCAFLNSRGGQLIFGVEDNGRICGVARSLVDQINLMVDNCYADLVTASGLQLPRETILTHVRETTDANSFVVIVECAATDGLYQFRSGDVFYRNNASNMRYSGIVYRTESEFIALRQSLEQSHEDAIREMHTHYAANCVATSADHESQINQLIEQHRRELSEQISHSTVRYHNMQNEWIEALIVAIISIIFNLLAICYWFWIAN